MKINVQTKQNCARVTTTPPPPLSLSKATSAPGPSAFRLHSPGVKRVNNLVFTREPGSIFGNGNHMLIYTSGQVLINHFICSVFLCRCSIVSDLCTVMGGTSHRRRFVGPQSALVFIFDLDEGQGTMSRSRH